MFSKSLFFGRKPLVFLAGSFLTMGLGSLLAIKSKSGSELPLEEENPPKVAETQRLPHVEMGQVTSITVSRDGNQAYAASFGAGTLSILDRDPITGTLKFRKSLKAAHHPRLVAFRLSPDGKFGAGSDFGADNLILFSRDPKTGDLKEVDHVNKNKVMPELGFCIDNVFSPDSRYLYAVGSMALTVFEIVDSKLVHLESHTDPNQGQAAGAIMSGARGVAISPNGKWVYSSWNQSGSLVVHQRDPDTGLLTLAQALRAGGKVPVKGLTSVMHCTVSPDGNFVYTSGGRFGGADAVCCFKVGIEGNLTLVQQLLGDDLPEGFGGGNEIAISPKGDLVAVACTTADQLARFSRDRNTGRLEAIDSVQSGEEDTPGAAGVCFDPTGRDILVADENSNSIVVFRNIRQ